MTLAIGQGYTSQVCAGDLAPIAVTFPVYVNVDGSLDLVVELRDATTDALIETAVYPTHYSFTRAAAPAIGGTLTPLSATVFASGRKAWALRTTKLHQETRFGELVKFPAQAVEQAFDRVSAALQDVSRNLARAPLVAPGQTPSDDLLANVSALGLIAGDLASLAAALTDGELFADLAVKPTGFTGQDTVGNWFATFRKTAAVATIAALQALSFPSYADAPDHIIASTSYFAGDGGGTFVKAAAGADDGGVTIATQTAGIVYLRQRGSGVYFPTWYGAHPTLQTAANNASAINATITLAANEGGGRVVMPNAPAGSELSFSAQIILTNKSHVILCGQGTGTNGVHGVVLKWTGGATAAVYANAASGVTTGIGLENIQINGNGLATRCVDLRGHTFSRFMNVGLSGATGVQRYEDVSDGGVGPQRNLWLATLMEGGLTAGCHEWGNASADFNVNFNDYYSQRLIHKDGVAWRGRNADSNIVYGCLIQRQAGGTAAGVYLHGSNTILRNCRANYFYGLQSPGAITEEVVGFTYPAVNNIFQIITESGSAPAVRDDGKDCFWSGPGYARGGFAGSELTMQGRTSVNLSTGTQALFPDGLQNPGSSSSQFIMPRPGIVRGLYSYLNTAPGVGNTRSIFVRKNGVATALNNVYGAAENLNKLVTGAISFVAGDTLDMVSEATVGTPAASILHHTVFYTYNLPVDR